jgi:hypothetical protein
MERWGLTEDYEEGVKGIACGKDLQNRYLSNIGFPEAGSTMLIVKDC